MSSLSCSALGYYIPNAATSPAVDTPIHTSVPPIAHSLMSSLFCSALGYYIPNAATSPAVGAAVAGAGQANFDIPVSGWVSEIQKVHIISPRPHIIPPINDVIIMAPMTPLPLPQS